MNPRTWRPRRSADPVVGRTWLSIRVDLIAGRGEALWPRPGRVFAAARSHTFAQLATAIDDAFAYVFDFGDQWEHLCTVGPQRIDPVETLGILPDQPLPYFGWGDIPDQYQRRWDGDDGESPLPRRPRHPYADLPPLLRGWGAGREGSVS